jgi:uncharacterized integral membrane protein
MAHRPDDGESEPAHDAKGWTERREGPSRKLIVAAIAAVVLLVFVLQNTERANIDFLIWNGAFPLWGMILIAAALGFIGGAALSRGRRARRAARADKRRGA